MADHPSLAELRQFLLGEAPPKQTQTIVQHLAGNCQTCKASLSPISSAVLDARTVRTVVQPAANPDYDAILDAAADRCTLWQDRVSVALKAFRDHLRSGGSNPLDFPLDRISGLPLVRAYIDLAYELRYSSVGAMFQATQRAYAAAQGLEAGTYGPNLVADYQAWALAEVANALRVKDELKSAWERIREAQDRLEEGTGDLFLQAHVGEIEAAIRADRREFAAALRLLDRTFEAYLALGEAHFAGRALISRAVYTDVGGEPGKALELLQRATELIDPERDPLLTAIAQQNYLNLLAQTGQYRAAAAYLLESGLRRKLEHQPLSLAKLRWVEGKVLRGLQRFERAEAAFEAARLTFRDHQSRYNAALVGLDLAEVWGRQGCLEKVQAVATETLKVFESLGVLREARVAVQFLRATCHIQHAVPEVAQRVNRFLTRLEVQPELVFEQFLAASGD